MNERRKLHTDDTVMPQVNMNGTAREPLIQGYTEAARAVEVALDVLLRNSPHGRDYQTLPASTFKRAMTQHDTRCRMLKLVRDELLDIAGNIFDQGKK